MPDKYGHNIKPVYMHNTCHFITSLKRSTGGVPKELKQ